MTPAFIDFFLTQNVWKVIYFYILHKSTRLTCPLFSHLKHVGCPNKYIGGIFYLGRTPPIKHKTEVFTLVTVLLIVTDKTNVLDEVHMIMTEQVSCRCVVDFYPNSEPKNPLEEFSFFSASSINSRPFASLSAIVMWLKMSQTVNIAYIFTFVSHHYLLSTSSS